MTERELGCDVIGGTRPRHIMTEDPVDPAAVVRKGQSQPKQDDMVASLRRPADDAMGRRPLLRDASMNPPPICCAIPGEHLADAPPCDFLAVDIPQPRPGQPKQAVIKAVPKIDEPEIRKKSRYFERIEVGTRRHTALTGGLKPVVEEFTLSLRHQLCLKGASGQHLIPPRASLAGLANRCELPDYVEFRRHMQGM
jgi:hypothetical protein